MLRFKKGCYWVHSWASAGRELKGNYFSELLYQIDVAPRPKGVPYHGTITVRRPAHFMGTADRVVKKMTEDNQLTKSEFDFYKKIQDDLENRLREIQNKLSQTQ